MYTSSPSRIAARLPLPRMAILAMAAMLCTISLIGIRNRTSWHLKLMYESLKGTFHLLGEGRLIVFAIAASPIPLEPLCPVTGLTAPREPF